MITVLFLLISVIFYSLIYYYITSKDDFYMKNENTLPIITSNVKNNPNNPNTQKKISIDNLTYIDLLYFSVITQTTIGYGDIVPKSRRCRLIVIVQVFTSLAIFELALEKLF